MYFKGKYIRKGSTPIYSWHQNNTMDSLSIISDLWSYIALPLEFLPKNMSYMEGIQNQHQ